MDREGAGCHRSGWAAQLLIPVLKGSDKRSSLCSLSLDTSLTPEKVSLQPLTAPQAHCGRHPWCVDLELTAEWMIGDGRGEQNVFVSFSFFLACLLSLLFCWFLECFWLITCHPQPLSLSVHLHSSLSFSLLICFLLELLCVYAEISKLALLSLLYFNPSVHNKEKKKATGYSTVFHNHMFSDDQVLCGE